MNVTRTYRRVGVVWIEEKHELIDGEWLRIPGQPTIDDKINEFLNANKCYPEAVSSPMIHQLQRPGEENVRYMRIGMSFIYVPNEVISDGQGQEVQIQVATEQDETLRRLLQNAGAGGLSLPVGAFPAPGHAHGVSPVHRP